MQNFSNYTVMQIQENLNQKLAEFYDKNSARSKLYSESYTALIHEVLQKECSDKDARSLSKLHTQKMRIRNTKRKRYYTRCKDMVDTKMWASAQNTDAFCFRDVIFNFNLLSEPQLKSLYSGKSIEEVISDRLNDVETWSIDSSSMMIDYPGTEKATAKSLYSNFLLDLTLDILRVIKELYDNDLAGQTVSYLENLSDKAIFGAFRERIPISKSGVTQIKISRDASNQKYTVITYDGTGDKGFVNLLDAIDLDIVAYFVTRTIQASPTERPIMIEESVLVKVSMGGSKRKPSKTDYDMLHARLYKLRHMTFDLYEPEHSASFNLISDYKYVETNGRRFVAYFPGGFIEDQVESGMIMRLPTEVKNALDTSVAKLLYVPFMQQRIRIYRMIVNGQKQNGLYTVQFKHSDFLRYVNFGDGNKRDGHAAMEAALQDYMRINSIVHDYSYSAITDTYTVEFYALSDTEIADIDFMLYNQDVKKLSDNIVGQILLTDLINT